MPGALLVLGFFSYLYSVNIRVNFYLLSIEFSILTFLSYAFIQSLHHPWWKLISCWVRGQQSCPEKRPPVASVSPWDPTCPSSEVYPLVGLKQTCILSSPHPRTKPVRTAHKSAVSKALWQKWLASPVTLTVELRTASPLSLCPCLDKDNSDKRQASACPLWGFL